jgi:hypothetical protein
VLAVSVDHAQIIRDGRIEPSLPAAIFGNLTRNKSRDGLERLANRLDDELFLRGKSPVETTNREAAFLHHIGDRYGLNAPQPKAVGGLYQAVLSPLEWQVRCGTALDWKVEQKSAGIDRILPAMRTDIVLDHKPSSRRIVIDTKFTSIVTTGWHCEETLRSGHVYQIYAYLRSQAGRGDATTDSTCGLLLHPSVGSDVDEAVVIQGHAIRFATVDLTASTSSIRLGLLNLTKAVLIDHRR